MNTGPRILTLLCLAGLGQLAQADPYYTGNPYAPYPPGCITLLEKQPELYGDNRYRFFSSQMTFEVVRKIDTDIPSQNTGKARVDMYRVACSEPDRSVIMVEFTLPNKWAESRLQQFLLPEMNGSLFDWGVGFELRAEPNTWSHSIQQTSLTRSAFGDYTYGWDDPRRYTWRYVLDVQAQYPAYYGGDLASEYNKEFFLEIHREGTQHRTIRVPATQSVLQANPHLPLNGRLGGNWVEKGSENQGLLLSFGSRVPRAGSRAINRLDRADAELVVFLSWFTFDANGHQLWLTGSTRFPQGQYEVQIPIEQVSGGTFMGNTRADRTDVGTVRLQAKQCNDLSLDYDLRSLGLDAGTLRLERLDSLEIAGYPCRDYWARLQSTDSAQP